MWVALKRAFMLCVQILHFHPVILPSNSTLQAKVRAEDLSPSNGLPCGIAHPGDILEIASCNTLLWHTVSIWTCLPRSCEPHEVVKDTGGPHTQISSVRADSKNVPVHSPLGGEDAKGIFNDQPGTAEAVIEDPLLSGDVGAWEGSHQVSA